MFTAVRPCLSAGVALVGASVIAVTPISPAPLEKAPASYAVQLAAIPSPLQLYPQVFVKSLLNTGALLEQYFSDPFPIIRATLENQAAAFKDAVTALQTGSFDEFFVAVADFVLQPLKSIGQSIGEVVSYFGLVLGQPGGREYLFNAAFSPLLNGIAATRLAIADVFEAITTFDVIGLVNAVINIPARIIDGVLNGVPEDFLFGGYYVPALLTPLETSLPPGLISQAIYLNQYVGEAIAPEAPAAINEWSGPEAQAMMLRADPETELVAVQEQLPTEDEAVLGEQGPVTEVLDLPTSDVPGEDVSEEDVSEEDVSEEDVSEEEMLGEDVSEEADDLLEEEPAPAQEQALPDTALADDEPSSPAPTDEANHRGTEAND